MPDLRYFGICTVSSKTTAINRNDIFIDIGSIKAYDHFQYTEHKMLAFILAASVLFLYKLMNTNSEFSHNNTAECYKVSVPSKHANSASGKHDRNVMS